MAQREPGLPEQISERIIQMILDENLKQGDRLPKEAVLVERVAFWAAMRAIWGSIMKRTSSKSRASCCLSSMNVKPRGSSATPGFEAT